MQLSSQYVLWCVHPDQEGYEPVAVSSVRTLREFWSLYAHVRRPAELGKRAQYHFFREGCEPRYEDEQHKHGGRWWLRVPLALADRAWEALLLCVVAGHFDVGPNDESDFMGASISIKSRMEVSTNTENVFADISVWCRNFTHEKQNELIRARFLHALLLATRPHSVRSVDELPLVQAPDVSELVRRFSLDSLIRFKRHFAHNNRGGYQRRGKPFHGGGGHRDFRQHKEKSGNPFNRSGSRSTWRRQQQQQSQQGGNGDGWFGKTTPADPWGST